jgi:hypothetical protein
LVLKRLKLNTKNDLSSIGKREFFKSYVCWDKMTSDQRNKPLSWFQSLPDGFKGMFLYLLFFLFHLSPAQQLFFSFFFECVVHEAREDSVLVTQTAASVTNHTTKDDIVRLLHLFKEPRAQRHWTNLHGVMNRAELDSRKAPAVYAEASNPLCHLAEILTIMMDFVRKI